MSIHCSDVPTNITYNCTKPWGQNCTNHKGFHFASLWNYTQNIQNACANDTRLFVSQGRNASPQDASLTQSACAAIAGPDWQYYPAADIYTRLTTWKFPLLQLVASFPRPPLSFGVEFFVIVHLLGDPIDTIQNLLTKMSRCQRTAEFWRLECKTLFEQQGEDDNDSDWKALALVTDAYGEWDKDGSVITALQQGLSDNPQDKKIITTAIRKTGCALAADRATKFLPIIVAQAFFIGGVAVAILRTISASGATASSDTVFINVEAHSVAFSSLYFWIIPTAFLGSIIGVSQTEAAIPRILERFQVDLDRLNLQQAIGLPNQCLIDSEERVFSGGLYSWLPLKRVTSGTSATYRSVLAYMVVIIGTLTGILISALVPPDEWGCRNIGEVLIFGAWLLSALSDHWLKNYWPLKKNNRIKFFWTVCLKDILATVATMGGIITTQVGIFNRCSCYTRWGRTGLALPEMPDVAKTLFYRLHTSYLAITFTSISIELVFVPLIVCIWYRDALRTFVQRDDGISNADWLWQWLKACRALQRRLRLRSLRNAFRNSGFERTFTVVLEETLPGASREPQQQEFDELDQKATDVGKVEHDSVLVREVEHSPPGDPSLQSSGAEPLLGPSSNIVQLSPLSRRSGTG